MILRTNGRFIAFPKNNKWKILVTNLGDYQVLSNTGISRKQMLIIDKH